MQEYVEDKTVSISIKATKMTGLVLAQAMRALLNQSQDKKHKLGKQSLKSLRKHGSNLENIEIGNGNIGSFSRIARKYEIDFALKRDNTEMPPRWLVFFKGKDADSIKLAFDEYSKKMLKTQNLKPSILSKLNKFKELTKTTLAPVKTRNMGGHEL